MNETLSQLRASEPSGSAAGPRARHAHAPEGGLSTGTLLAFIVGSFFVHGGAYAALSSLPERTPLLAQAPQELTFTVVAPEPVVEETVKPAPMPPEPVRAKAPRPVLEPEPKPVAAPQPEPQVEEPAPIQHLESSSESGLTVAGTVGAPQPIAGTSLTGAEGGTGLGKAAPSDGATRIDLRRLAKEWALKVNAAVTKQALHEYPRSALRAHVEGVVVLSVIILPSGEVQTAQLARTSGHPQLDDAALASTRALRVPPPPPALHRYLAKAITIPVNYTMN
jgi:protein TonB